MTSRPYKDILNEVKSKEDEISILTGKINESIRNQVQIEIEANNLLGTWRKISSNGEKAKKCKEEIEKINARDIDEHKKHDLLRKEKNRLQHLLREDIFSLLNHPNPPKERDNLKKLESTDLLKSSLLSGTSRSSIGDVDFSRILKSFVIDEANIPIEITTSVKKLEEKYDQDSKLSSEDPYYGKIYKGRVMGKEVCVKILSKLDQKQIRDLQRHYENMRKQVTHSHLLPPIAASKKENEEKVIVDLAQGEYHSLEDFLLSHDRKQKIGFMTKLKYAKDISSALAWLHGKNLLHLRLKPSNILFTKDWKIKVADYGLDLPAVPNSPEGWIKSGHAFFYPPELLDPNDPKNLTNKSNDPKNLTNKSPAVDVYSFGLVLYTLLTEKFPYTEAVELKMKIAREIELEKKTSDKAGQIRKIEDLKKKLKMEQSKTIEELLQKVKENPVQLDATLYPPKIVDLIKRCTSMNPVERPKFAELTEGSFWLEIYQDMVSAGNEKGQAIWMTAANHKQTQTIPWDKFAPVLWKELEVSSPPDPLQVECVKTMLYLENEMVVHKHWLRFLQWFSPLRTGKDGKEYLSKVVELLKAPWFYGRETDRVQSDAVMNKVLEDKNIMGKKENKGKQPFLVRVAISQGEKFCLVCCSGPKINHIPINAEDYVEFGIFKYITDMAKKKNWFPTAKDRIFNTLIFDKPDLLQSKDETGPEEDQIRSVVQPNSVVGKTKYI